MRKIFIHEDVCEDVVVSDTVCPSVVLDCTVEETVTQECVWDCEQTIPGDSSSNVCEEVCNDVVTYDTICTPVDNEVVTILDSNYIPGKTSEPEEGEVITILDTNYIPTSTWGTYIVSVYPELPGLVKIDFLTASLGAGTVTVSPAGDLSVVEGVTPHLSADITLSPELNSIMEKAEVVFSYADIAGNIRSQSDLTIAYYNESTGEYENLAGVIVNEDDQTVSATVTHFSTYVLAEIEGTTAVRHHAGQTLSIRVLQRGISLELEEAQHVSIDLLNPDGSRQAAVFSGMADAGTRYFKFDQANSDRGYGLSLVRVRTGNGESFTRLVR